MEALEIALRALKNTIKELNEYYWCSELSIEEHLSGQVERALEQAEIELEGEQNEK